MLKTTRNGEVWLVTQPAHAELSGTMAAHWGNDSFARPGCYEQSTDPDRLRREVVLAISEHDNGWWEWEADPALSDADGLPQGLSEVLKDPAAGMERWRLGVPRLAARHPYASLLIGDHACWLYAAQFDPDPPPEFTHHLQRGRSAYPKELQEKARQFLVDVRGMQAGFRGRMESEPLWREALEPAHRNPHTRLLQALDAFSLALCSAIISPSRGEARGFGEDEVVFDEVPRRSWEDRVPIGIKPLGEGRIAVDPYPFDESPLTLSVPLRVARPHTWWRQAPRVLKQFTCLPQ